nr:hypothetical protein BaRGS_029881 [Batillaria attramentaria]KAG5689945.1 hypothetical protein BaRGS_031710 [Batillaria attramentaria]
MTGVQQHQQGAANKARQAEDQAIEAVAGQYEEILKELHVLGPDASTDDYKELDIALLSAACAERQEDPSVAKPDAEPEAPFPSSHGSYPVPVTDRYDPPPGHLPKRSSLKQAE